MACTVCPQTKGFVTWLAATAVRQRCQGVKESAGASEIQAGTFPLLAAFAHSLPAEPLLFAGSLDEDFLLSLMPLICHHPAEFNGTAPSSRAAGRVHGCNPANAAGTPAVCPHTHARACPAVLLRCVYSSTPKISLAFTY